MVLIKCKCGCFFTIKDSDILNTKRFRCQSCDNNVFVNDYECGLKDVQQAFSESEMTLQKIPDNAKITITFDT